MLENLDKIMHLLFNFDTCPVQSPFGFVHLMHQNLSASALFCLNLLTKVNMLLLIYKYGMGNYRRQNCSIHPNSLANVTESQDWKLKFISLKWVSSIQTGFFTKFVGGWGLVFKDDFWSPVRWGGGVTCIGDGVRWRGIWKNCPLRPKCPPQQN